MSAQKTKFPKNTVPARRMHQGTTIVGKNGLPIDALAILEPGTSIINGTTAIDSYSAPTVTVKNSVDLTPLIQYYNSGMAGDFKHTGILLFTDSLGASAIIDPDSINNTTKTFDIYKEEELTDPPVSIDTKKGWLASEAELVNRLQTTSSAVIDSVEFRDIDIKFELDGDPVRIIDSNKNELGINEDGSVNVNITTDDPNSQIINTYTEISSLASSGTFTTIASYTAPVGSTTFLQKVAVSGENIAEYVVRVDGVVLDKKRTYHGDGLNDEFHFDGPPSENGQEVPVGQIILVQVRHQRPMSADFNARIQAVVVAD